MILHFTFGAYYNNTPKFSKNQALRVRRCSTPKLNNNIFAAMLSPYQGAGKMILHFTFGAYYNNTPKFSKNQLQFGYSLIFYALNVMPPLSRGQFKS